MSEPLPPTIDPVAAIRWQAMAARESPWLHEEVARRMQERLQWMVQAPAAWCHWDPLRGGLQAHALIAQRYPQAVCHVVETSSPEAQALVQERLARPWWSPARWKAPAPQFGLPPQDGVQMLWANMALHMSAQPQALMARWQRALAVDGYLMFSCLGPDTLRELRELYAELGWTPPGHVLTDMHDWGDMLYHAGFTEPVVDMERIVLTFATPERLLAELRGLGRNLHPQRFAGLRGRRWRDRLHQVLADRLGGEGGQLALTFEIVYGHAFKAPPRVQSDGTTSVSLEQMRDLIRTRGAT
jgi:malonyl-CoA O-methyltransferase